MSKVKIKGNSSGTGVLTIEAPNTNTDSTITLPDGTGELIQADASGNVGIGVTPESWNSSWTGLQIGGMGTISGETAEALGNQMSASNNAYLGSGGGWLYKMTEKATQHQQADGEHVFRVASSGTADSAISWTTAIIIDNSGQLKTESYVSDTSGHGCQIYSDGDQGQLAVRSLSTANRDVVSFANPNGRVGKISTSGTSTSFVTSSDYRLKENVEPMTGSIDRLKELNPSRFNFIADADTTVDGFLAHEAQEVVPEAITGTKDAMKTEEYEVTPAVMDGETELTPAIMGEREVEDYQGIDQSKLVPLLTSALQEAVAKIEDLEKRIEILEAK